MPSPAAQPKTALFGLSALTFLFFAWGFLTSLNDVILPHLRAVFSLTYAQGALVQTSFFLAYFVCSLPSSAVVARFGYKHGLAIGLGCMAIGALLFLPAASLVSFPLFLGALFVLGSGITLLQVAANPYVTMLGAPDKAASRLNLTQAFNSFGTTIAPVIGGSVILGALAKAGSDPAKQADVVRLPYMAIAVVLVVLAVAFYFMPLPEPTEEPAKPNMQTIKQALKSRPLSLGVLGIFLYVGVEVAIGSFMINFISAALGNTAEQAAPMVGLYWGAAMIGRFGGSALMSRVKPPVLLTIASLVACGLLALSLVTTGYTSIYALIAIGLCNAIMFPTIFSLGVNNLGRLSGIGSSLLVLGIVGGAVIPLGIGWLADQIGLGEALTFCAIGYAYIAFYGLYMRKAGSDVKVA